MDQKSLDQIHLCINEMKMVKQLIDSKAADTFCNRLLGIYVMMRVDDVTKIWSHNIRHDAIERILTEGVKTKYNDGLRTVRDKLGAVTMPTCATSMKERRRVRGEGPE